MAPLMLPAEMCITGSQGIILSPSARFKPCSTPRLSTSTLDSEQPPAPQLPMEYRHRASVLSSGSTSHIPGDAQQVPPPAAPQHSGTGTATPAAGTAASGHLGIIEYPKLDNIHKDHRVQLLVLHWTLPKITQWA